MEKRNKKRLTSHKFLDDEDRYWEDQLRLQSDPSYMTLDDFAAIEEELDVVSDTYFRPKIDKNNDEDDECEAAFETLQEYWKQLMRDRWGLTSVQEEFDDSIQSNPTLSTLDHYRNALATIDKIPEDKISVIFWQKQFDKFNTYCFDHKINHMLQLFNHDLNKLYKHGFNYTRIVQISAVMTAWAEKILNMQKTTFVENNHEDPTDNKHYKKILAMFFSNEDESDIIEAETETALSLEQLIEDEFD